MERGSLSPVVNHFLAATFAGEHLHFQVPAVGFRLAQRVYLIPVLRKLVMTIVQNGDKGEGVCDRESHGNAKLLEPEEAVQVEREAGDCGQCELTNPSSRWRLNMFLEGECNDVWLDA